MDKPSLPKGTRDFGPAQMAKRQFILHIIQSVFRKYGFQPLETPAMENLSTLTGKYGEEGDQLLFKILDSGDYFKELREKKVLDNRSFTKIKRGFIEAILAVINEIGENSEQREWHLKNIFLDSISTIPDVIEELPLITPISENAGSIVKQILETAKQEANRRFQVTEIFRLSEDIFNQLFDSDNQGKHLTDSLDSKSLTKYISEKGLRYDLTVPFARYVVMNRGELAMPFKRYQIQPVWRADRPQKGRYREFYQCDADVVGTDSLVNEAEIVLMIKEVFGALGIQDYSIKINHRGVLSGLAETAGAKGNEGSLFVAIDKLDKIGEEKVAEELRSKNFTDENITQVFETLKTTGTNAEKIQKLSERFTQSESGKKGLADLTQVFNLLKHYGSPETHVEFDISLARGLSYYTGPIFEVKVNNVAIGSVSGGGRYDNLVEAFGSKEKLSGVGISFGIDRIYDVMEELGLFPKNTIVFTKVLVVHMDEACMNFGLRVAQSLRVNNIPTEIYPDISKVKKQLDYANKKQIPFAVIIGPDEMAAGSVALKNLTTGEQENLDLHSLIEKLK